jgi:hypothetical protein
MSPPSERRFPRLPLAKAKPRTKARSREEDAKQSGQFPLPQFLRAFVASCETSSNPAAFREDLIDACMILKSAVQTKIFTAKAQRSQRER